MKKFSVAFILLFCVLLNACMSGGLQETADNGAKQVVFDFYAVSLELMKTDYEKMIRERCHFESQEKYQLALDNPHELKSFEILRIEQLSENLWVVETHYVCARYEFYDVDYVAMIGEEWKVMFTEGEIPQQIKAGVEIPEYNRESPDILGKNEN